MLYVIFWHFNKDEPMFNTAPLWKPESIVKPYRVINLRQNVTTPMDEYSPRR